MKRFLPSRASSESWPADGCRSRLPRRSFRSPLARCLISLLLIGFNSMALAQSGSFEWFTIPASIRAGQAFSATVVSSGAITNRAHLNAVYSQSSSTLLISEQNPSSGEVEFTNVGREPLDLTGWRVLFYDSVSNSVPRTTFQFPAGNICPQGQVCRIQFRVTPSGPGNFPLFTAPAPLLFNRTDPGSAQYCPARCS